MNASPKRKRKARAGVKSIRVKRRKKEALLLLPMLMMSIPWRDQ